MQLPLLYNINLQCLLSKSLKGDKQKGYSIDKTCETCLLVTTCDCFCKNWHDKTKGAATMTSEMLTPSQKMWRDWGLNKYVELTRTPYLQYESLYSHISSTPPVRVLSEVHLFWSGKTQNGMRIKGGRGSNAESSKIEATSFWRPFYARREKQQEQQSETIRRGWWTQDRNRWRWLNLSCLHKGQWHTGATLFHRTRKQKEPTSAWIKSYSKSEAPLWLSKD